MICAALLLTSVLAGAQQSVPALLEEGRRLLEAGKPKTAQERFDRAAELDGGSLATEVWVVRGWLALERVDEALTATDELKQRGAEGHALDYLYGLGFHAAAMREVASGGGAFTQPQFEDSARFLARATAHDPLLYGDAWLPLAESSWYAQQLDQASAAAARAVERRPDDGYARLVAGRIEFSRYSAARAAEAAPEVSGAHWAAALDAFEGAVDAYGAPRKELDQYRLAEAEAQIGHLHAWKEDPELAADAYGAAMGWDPRVIDFNQVADSIGNEALAEQIAEARRRFPKRHGKEHPGGPLLAWWDGYANYKLHNYAEAEAAFVEAIEGNPGYTNSWYYVFRSANGQRKFEDAVVALRTNWSQDPEGLVAAISGDLTRNMALLEYLVVWLIDIDEQPHGERYREAALLEEIRTRVWPEEPRYWNNLGLFLRDHGDQLKLAVEPPDPEQLDELWHQAYAAYLHALELAPDHPAYLNDTAVMLHYYLKRDWDEAERLYLRAVERADEELAGTNLSPGDRAWFETAREDAATNLERLRRMRVHRKGKSERPIEAGAGTGG